jgi:hypothetical protein
MMSGGLGTVVAIVILQPILIAQANNSMLNRIRLDRKSFRMKLHVAAACVVIQVFII